MPFNDQLVILVVSAYICPMCMPFNDQLVILVISAYICPSVYAL